MMNGSFTYMKADWILEIMAFFDKWLPSHSDEQQLHYYL